MNTYQSNIRKYKESIVELTKELKELSMYRLVAFVFSVFLIFLLAKTGLIIVVSIFVVICGVGFAFLINQYNKVAYQKQHAIFFKEINEHEILRMESKLSDLPTGQTFARRAHPYVADLDVFGSHSLFQLINRTTTESGSEFLAEWLSEAASKEVILDRQQAIKELTPKLEWRQDFQASGMHFINAKSNYKRLLAWLEKPAQLLPYKKKYLLTSIILGLLSTLSLLVHFSYAYTSGYILHTFPLIIILIVNFFLLKKLRSVAAEIIEDTQQNIKILGGYQSLIGKIESGEFHSRNLQQLQSVFNQHNYSATKEIRKLRKILEVSQLKGAGGAFGNQFYLIFNHLWLIDIYWMILTENWKARNSGYLKAWADAVSEFETLSSIAGFFYSNPSYTFPEIKEGACSLSFEMLGHPLVKSENRVCNNFDLKARDNIVIITGSNMAGKSTFLRTVGANLVLAFMGAPCCATSGEVSIMRIFSSMRTQDNLEEGISSFYAELKRVEELLKLIESGEAVFFLLDEMFKGTNSKDRHLGGFSLIKQLEELNAFGLISTHDLELADLAGRHKLVTNYSFNSEIRDGEMNFDYRLTPGLCKDFNASELMKRSGIKILSDI